MTGRPSNVLAALLAVMALSSFSFARIGPIDFASLVRGSDLIVLGEVLDITTIKGVKFARINVLETYKGTKVHELFVLAQPTWVCDISDANKDERALFFLYPYTDTREGLDKLSSFRSVSRKDLEQAGLGTSIFSIADAGRGRMPLRTIKGQEYATIWVWDVLLPANVHTVPGPRPQYRFIRSARLIDILELTRNLGRC
jgi:hypothetical protein